MSERVAVYPGSFDPPTYGHLDLIGRATKIFDHIVVAVARNREKEALFTVDERTAMLSEITKGMSRVEIASFEGLTVDFAHKCKAIALVRGLRVMSDFEFELTMAITNQKLNPEVDTVCLMPSEGYLLLSSRLVTEVAQLGGDVSEFVPPVVAEHIRARLGRR